MHTDTLKVIAVIVAIFGLFALAGRGDYQDALEAENARLKAAAAHCRLATAMREVRP